MTRRFLDLLPSSEFLLPDQYRSTYEAVIPAMASCLIVNVSEGVFALVAPSGWMFSGGECRGNWTWT
jgi:hypothetical protein